MLCDTYPQTLLVDLSLQAGEYVWLTYKKVYDIVIKVGNAIRHCGVGEVSCLLTHFVIFMYPQGRLRFVIVDNLKIMFIFRRKSCSVLVGGCIRIIF